MTTVESKVDSIVMSLSARSFSGIVGQARVRLTLLGLLVHKCMFCLLVVCLDQPHFMNTYLCRAYLNLAWVVCICGMNAKHGIK